MVLIYKIGGECIEVEKAVRAELRDGLLVCLDRRNAVVASFPGHEVDVYTSQPEIAQVIKDEACDDSAGVPAAG